MDSIPNNFLTEIEKCADQIKAGKVVIIPTDTIWGISCDAKNENAINKIYQLKNRAKNKPLIVLMKNLKQIENYFTKIPENFYNYYENAKEPTTFILPKAKNLNQILLSEVDKIAIRIPKRGIIKQILEKLDYPITSTSANFANDPTPLFYQDINQEILEKVDYVFPFFSPKSTENSNSKSSKIIEIMANNGIKIIRN